MKRRNTAIALILCMLVSMLPVYSHATEVSGFYKLIAEDTMTFAEYGISKDTKLNALESNDFGEGWAFPWSTSKKEYTMSGVPKVDKNGIFTGRPSSSSNARIYRGLSEEIDFSKDGTYTFEVTTKDGSVETQDFVCEIGDTGFSFGVYNSDGTHFRPQLKVPGASNVIFTETTGTPTGFTLVIVGEVVIKKNEADTFRVKAYKDGADEPDWFIEKTAEMGNQTASFIGVGFNYISEGAEKDGISRVRSVKAEYDNPEAMDKIEKAYTDNSVTAEEIKDAFLCLVDYTGADKETLIDAIRTHAQNMGLESAIYAEITDVTPDFTDGKVFAHEFEDAFDITYSYPLTREGSFYIKDLSDNIVAQSSSINGKKVTMEKVGNFAIGTSYVLTAEGVTDFKGDVINSVGFSTVVVPTVNITEGEKYDAKATIIWDETFMDSISASLKYPSGQIAENIENNLTVTEAGDYELSISATIGLLSDTTVINFTVLPDIKPEARYVKISLKDVDAPYETGSTLVGSYEFYDENSGDRLKEAILKWYRTDGDDKVFIGEGEEYTLTEADENQDIIFEVTPISDSLTNPVGDPTESEPFTGAYAPVATIITIDTSSVSVGSSLKAEFDFSDKNGDAEGEHIIRWYQFVDTDYVEITENVSSSGLLEITKDLIGRYVYATVTPTSKNKPYYGETITSREVEVKLPEGVDITDSETSDLPSFDVSYLYDNVNEYEIDADKTLLETYVYPSGVTGKGFSTNWSSQNGKYVAPTGSATFFQKVKSAWSISWRGPNPIYRTVKNPFSMAANGTYTFITDVYEYGGGSSDGNLDESDFRMYIGGTDFYYGYTDDGESLGFIPQIKAKGKEEVSFGEHVDITNSISIMRIRADVEVTDGEDIFKVKMWKKGAEEPEEWSVVTTGEIGDHNVGYVSFTPNPGGSNGCRYFYFSANYENVALKNEINSLISKDSATEEELTKAFCDMSKYPEGDDKDAIISALKNLAGDIGIHIAEVVEASPSSDEKAVANETKTIRFKYNFALGQGTFELKDESGTIVPTTTTINENKVILAVTGDLVNGMEYTIDASGVTDYKGDVVPGFTFTTYATPEINVSDDGTYSQQSQIIWNESQASDITVSLTTPTGETNEIANGYVLNEVGEYSLTISGSANGNTDMRTITFVVEADIAPVASKLSIRGFHETGATLTGSYIYSDENNDAESGSELLWYRVNGNSKKLIGTGLTYTLKPADENANIIFAVIPKSNSIVNPVGEETFSDEFKGAYAPVAKELTIGGEINADKEIYASYRYFDENNDVESNSTIKWYFEDGTEITENISNGKLTITEDIFENKVYVSVTPETTKKPTTGTTVVSNMILMPSKPIVSDVKITGKAATGNMLTASYKFFDPNIDVEGISRYEWKNASTGEVLGTNRTLEITKSMAGKSIIVAVTGVSENIPTDSETVVSEVYKIPSNLSSSDKDDDFKYSGSTSGSGGGGGGKVPSTQGTTTTTPAKVVFSDITNHWAKEYISALLDKGIVSKDENFRPNDSISRAEVLAMLFRSAGITLSKYEGVYTDVKMDQWYADYVQTALDMGIISADEIFRPNDSITREETAKMVANMLNLVAETEANFTDNDLVSDWAKGYVNAVCEAGIFKGDENGNFNPKGELKRAETATVIYRLLDADMFKNGGAE